MSLPSPLGPSSNGELARRRGEARAGKQARGICNWAHPLSIGGGGLTGGVTGERRRRAGGGAATGTRIPARTGAELVNVWHGQLH
jgi:hypothetical protein